MANTVIQIKSSGAVGNVPTTLLPGELAINYEDGKLYYGNSASQTVLFDAVTEPSGLDGEIQFNDSGSFGSDAGLSYNKTTNIITIDGGAVIGGVNVVPRIASAFDTANSKTFTFEQNTAPTSPNSSDFWVNSDTGFMYQNFGNTTNPIWAEVGPTGTSSDTQPGAISASSLSVSYVGNNAAIQVVAANTRGGTGYSDFLTATNASGGVTNPNKYFRLNGSGGIEIINSAYSATLLTLTDAGSLSVGSTVSSTGFNVNNKQAVNGPAFRAYVDSSQSITSGSQQKVTFGSETFDTNNNFASSRFTPTVEGYYQLNATVRIAGSSGGGEVMITIWKNGSEYARGVNEGGTEQGANWYSMQVSDLAYANGTGDYFEIYVQQSSGGNRDTTAGQNISYFSGSMVRGA